MTDKSDIMLRGCLSGKGDTQSRQGRLNRFGTTKGKSHEKFDYQSVEVSFKDELFFLTPKPPLKGVTSTVNMLVEIPKELEDSVPVIIIVRYYKQQSVARFLSLEYR